MTRNAKVILGTARTLPEPATPDLAIEVSAAIDRPIHRIVGGNVLWLLRFHLRFWNQNHQEPFGVTTGHWR